MTTRNRLARLTESSRLNDEISRMRNERDGLLEDARNLHSGIYKLEKDFGSVMDVGKAPEDITKLLEKFEANAGEKSKMLEDVNGEFTKVRAESLEMEDSFLAVDEDSSDISLPANIDQDLKDKKINSNAKLNDIFSKLKKQHHDLLHSMVHDIDQDISSDNVMESEAALVPILQRKCTSLKKDVEVAESKARSISAQWTADKKLHDEAIATMKAEMAVMLAKLQLAESKQRFAEQMSRDDSGKSSSVSRAEYEDVQRECSLLREKLEITESESSQRFAKIQQMQNEINHLQASNLELERLRSKLLQKQEHLSRGSNYWSDKVKEMEDEYEQKLAQVTVEKDQEIEKLRARLDQLERDVDSKNVHIENLKEAKLSLEQEKWKSEADYKALVTSMEFLTNEFKQKLFDAEEMSRKARVELDAAVGARDEAQERAVGLDKLLRTTAANVQEAVRSSQAQSMQLLDSFVSAYQSQTERCVKMEKELKDIKIGFEERLKNARPTRSFIINIDAPELQPKSVQDFEVQCNIMTNADIDSRPVYRRASMEEERPEGYANIRHEQSIYYVSCSPVGSRDGGDSESEDEYLSELTLKTGSEDSLEMTSLRGSLPLPERRAIKAEVSTQTEFKPQFVLDVPRDLAELRKHPQPPAHQPLHTWSTSQVKAYLGEALFLGPVLESAAVALSAFRMNQKMHVEESITEEHVYEKVVMAERAIQMEAHSIQTDLTSNQIQEFDSKIHELTTSVDTLKEENKSLLGEIKVLQEAAQDWNTDSKWIQIAKTDEGKAFIRDRLDDFIQDAVRLIVKDENSPPSNEAEQAEQMERMQARQAMLLKLKGVQALQSQLPEDFIQLDEKFIGIKLEYPPELLDYLRRHRRHHGDLQAVRTPTAIPQAVLTKLSESSEQREQILKHGDIRRENFERLKGKGFGPDILIDLTVLDYHAQSLEIDEDDSGKPKAEYGMTMQHRALIMERDALRARVLNDISIEDLSKWLHTTDKQYTMLSTLDAWKRLIHFASGGQFRDILGLHMRTIQKCIVGAGGLPKAMQRVVARHNLEESTVFWPEHFRVQVLEYFRSELCQSKYELEEQLKKSQLHIDQLQQNIADLEKSKAVLEETRSAAPQHRSKMGIGMGIAMLHQKAVNIRTKRDTDGREAASSAESPGEGGTNTRSETRKGHVSVEKKGVVESASRENKTQTSVLKNGGSRTELIREESNLGKGALTRRESKMRSEAHHQEGKGRPSSRERDRSPQSPMSRLKKSPSTQQLPAKKIDDSPVKAEAPVVAATGVEESSETVNVSEDVSAARKTSEDAASNGIVSDDRTKPGKLPDARADRPSLVSVSGRYSDARGIRRGSIRSSIRDLSKLGSDADKSRSRNSSVPSTGGSKRNSIVEEAPLSGVLALAGMSAGVDDSGSSAYGANELLKFSLHRPADRIALGIFRGDANRVELAEALLLFLGNWNDGKFEDAEESIPDIQKLWSNEEEKRFITNLIDLFHASSEEGTVPLEVTEIFSKLNEALELQAKIELFALTNASKDQPSALLVKLSNEFSRNDLDAEPLRENQTRRKSAISPSLAQPARRISFGLAAATVPVSGSSMYGNGIEEPLEYDMVPSEGFIPSNTNLNRRPGSPSESERQLQPLPEYSSTANSLDADDSSLSSAGTMKDSAPADKVITASQDSGHWQKRHASRILDRKHRERVLDLKYAELDAKKPIFRAASTAEIGTQTVFDMDIAKLLGEELKELGLNGVTKPEDSSGEGGPSPSSGFRPGSGDFKVLTSLVKETEDLAPGPPQLLPPFRLVHICNQGELELCPGVFLCTKVPLPPVPSPPVPRGIWLIRRTDFAPLLHGIEEAPSINREMPGPLPNSLPDGISAAFLPPILPLGPGLDLVPGADFGGLLELPPGIVVVRLGSDSSLLAGMEFVELSPFLALAPGFKVPPGLTLAQQVGIDPICRELEIEPGISIQPGINTANAGLMASISLPPGVSLVSQEDGVPLPKHLHPVLAENDVQDILAEQNFMLSSVRLLRRPPGLDLPMGMELIHRPADVPLPTGMTAVPSSVLPSGLKMPPGVEIVQLEAYYDLPAGIFIGKNVEVYPRIPFMYLPRNVVLVMRHMQAPIPFGFRRVPMPDLPYNISSLPVSVEAVEMVEGAHLQPGVELCPGIVVTESADLKLPLGFEVVSRQPWADCPPGMERCMRNDLPPMTRLPKGVEVLRFIPRFQLPPGVVLGNGATLGKNVQLWPGLQLDGGVQVVRWPQGVFLPRHTELVRLPPDHPNDVPPPYHKVDVELPKGLSFPPGCVPVTLPSVLRLPTARQLAHTYELVTPPAAFHSHDLPPGVVLIKKRGNRDYGVLPAEMSILPKSALPHELAHNFYLNAHTIVRLAPRTEIPVGIELAHGVRVAPIPYGLFLPPNVTLVRVAPEASIPSGFELCAMNTADGDSPALDKDVFPVIVPYEFRVTSWGPLGIGTPVECQIPFPPPGAQTVELNSSYKYSDELPAGLRLASAKELYPGILPPPGVSVVLFPQYYYLPQCIGIEQGIDSFPERVRLTPGELLCPGVQVTGKPQGLSLPPGLEVVRRENQDTTFVDGVEPLDKPTIVVLLGEVTPNFSERFSFVRVESPIMRLRHRISLSTIKAPQPAYDSGSHTGQYPSVKLLMRLQPGMYNDPSEISEFDRLQLRSRSSREEVGASEDSDSVGKIPSSAGESRMQKHEREQLQRSNMILKREMRELQNKFDKCSALLNETKQRVLSSESEARNLDAEATNAKLDLEISKSQAIHMEASLRSRIVELEAARTRTNERVRDLHSQLNKQAEDLHRWKHAKDELEREILEDAELRGRISVQAEIGIARAQVVLQCKKVIDLIIRVMCGMVGNAITCAYEAEAEEYARRQASMQKQWEVDKADAAEYGGRVINVTVDRGEESGYISSDGEDGSHPRYPDAGGAVTGFKKSQEISIDTGDASASIDSSHLYTLSQARKMPELPVISHKKHAPKPMSSKRKRRETTILGGWEALVVHMAQLQSVPKPKFEADQEYSDLLGRVNALFVFGEEKKVNAEAGILVIDQGAAEEIFVSWAATNGDLLHKYVGALLGRYLEVIRLAEVEVQAQMSLRRDSARRVRILTNKLQEMSFLNPNSTTTSAPPAPPGLVAPPAPRDWESSSFAISTEKDNMKVEEKLLQLQLRLEEMKLQGQGTFLELLQEQSRRMVDLAEMHSRLSFAAIILQKQAQDEDERRKMVLRGRTLNTNEEQNIEADKMDKAVQLHIRKLKNQAETMIERAAATKLASHELKVSMRQQLEEFECAVQEVLEPDVLSKLLQYGYSRRQSAATLPALTTSLANRSSLDSLPEDSLISPGSVSSMLTSKSLPVPFTLSSIPKGKNSSKKAPNRGSGTGNTSLGFDLPKHSKFTLESIPSYMKRPASSLAGANVSEDIGDNFSIKSLGGGSVRSSTLNSKR